MVIQRDIKTVKFMSKQTYDIAIIGGGHNGLTTAFQSMMYVMTN